MKRLALIFLAAAFWCSAAFAQDQNVRVTGAYVEVGRGLAWGSTQFNRTFIFTPSNPDQSMCVFVANNNPTNAHTFTLAVSQTGDPQVSDFSNNQGRWIADTVQGNISPVAAASMTTAFVHSNAGAKVALQFSGGATQAGNPDTADVFLVQTNATSCGPVQQGSPIAVALPTQNASGSLNAFFTASNITNPGAASGLLQVETPASPAKSLLFGKLIVSTTAAATIQIAPINGVGTGCAFNGNSNTPLNTAVTTASPGTAQVATSCATTNPAFPYGSFNIALAANTVTVIDLSGFIASKASATRGLGIFSPAAVTGTISTYIDWFEQ